jgi:2-oxoglutarate dehydrogenase E1 component
MSQDFSDTSIHNLAYIEELHEAYRRDRNSVSAEWQAYFNAGQNGKSWTDQSVPSLIPQQRSIFNPAPVRAAATNGDYSSADKERIFRLIRAYRVRGHNIARIHPIGEPPPAPPELDPAYFGITNADLSRPFSSETLFWPGQLTLGQILRRLHHTYCRSIGVEYMHIDAVSIRRWLQKRLETTENHIQLSRQTQLRILTKLTDAVIFEEFVRKKFIGAKTFSLEGCESLIPLLDLAIEKAGGQGVKEIVLGMAHRGRLNVLANIMGKSPRQMFREFADIEPEKYIGGGDVKYHLGHSNDWVTAEGNRIHLSLCFNPSHLEYVNTVVLGRVRAKQDRVNNVNRDECLALLIHGDAAFAGEGIIQETLNLSQLGGYSVGGTLHVIVNNQIGFTTPPAESRSSIYATEVARMLQIPIFHVNGEDPEAVAQCVEVAMDFRRQFKRDVVIDMYGYRKLGHNEADEPTFTQPLLYRAIERRKPIREGYLEHLLALNEVTREEADKIAEDRRQQLEKELTESRSENYQKPPEKKRGVWERVQFYGGPESAAKPVKTAVDQAKLSELLNKLTVLPATFTPHPKIEKLLEVRREMAAGRKPLDWGAGEALAMATLVTENVRVRLSGQDSRRGTFSHRHAVLYDYEGRGIYTPLQNLEPNQARIDIINSPLSESGVLGFDYGYSLDTPDGLVMWEAQFGDFVNVAQVIIDQFIASAEAKWHRYSGIVMLLPHGFEGMGPEHSSARLERFLELCAVDNIQVVYPTTPAQIFHLLRQQVLRQWRKPLVVMTPKSLLRLPEASSSLEELATGEFQKIIPDQKIEAKKAKRVLLCTGKIYYELLKARTDLKREDVAIVRVEQLYPLRADILETILKTYAANTPVYWVQEEPENMGACRFLRTRLGERLFDRHPLTVICRPESASPATGSPNAHKIEQTRIINAAFA